MNGIQVRTIVSLIGSVAILIIFTIITSFSSAPSDILPEFRQAHTNGSIMLGILEYFPVAILSGVLLCWSFLINKNLVKKSLGSVKQFSKLVQPSLVIAMVTVAIYVFSLGFFEGPARTATQKAHADTELAQYYFTQSQAYFDQEEYRRAQDFIRMTIAVAPGWNEARNFHDTIEQKVNEAYNPAIARAETSLGPTMNDDLTWDDLIAKAEESANGGDLFTAIYWAELAEKSGTQEQRVKAGLLMETIRERIGYFDLESVSSNGKSTYELKQRAIMGQYRQGDYRGAYYTLRELESIDKYDKELSLWLPRVIEALEEEAFFSDEIEESLGHASSGSVFARIDTPGSARTLVHVKRVLRGKSTFYLTGLQILELDEGGRVTFHASAENAKVIPNDDGTITLLTKSIGRTNEGPVTESFLVKGTRPDGEQNLFKLNISGNELWSMANNDGSGINLGLFELVPLRTLLMNYGWDIRSIDLQILQRFTKLGVFLVLWFLSIAVGWSNRSRHLVLPIPLLLPLLLAVPVVLFYAMELFTWSLGIILGASVLALGTLVTTSICIGLVSLGLIVSLLLLSLQKVD